MSGGGISAEDAVESAAAATGVPGDARKRVAKFVWRTVPFAASCIIVNLLGLAASQFLGSSVLFLDMIGTAYASFTRGIGYGVVVGLSSNLLGQLFPSMLFGATFDPDSYKWFGLVNAAGAIVWAVVPRLWVISPRRFRFLPSRDVLSGGCERGYRRLLFHVVFIGTVTGVVASIVGYMIQWLILDCPSQPAVCARATVTAATSTALSEAWSGWLAARFGQAPIDWLTGTLNIVILIAFNIFDKILTTAAAIVLTLSWSKIPNYHRQTDHLSNPDVYARYKKSPIRTFAISLYIAFILVFAFLYLNEIPRNNEYPGSLIFAAISFLLLISVAAWGRKFPLYIIFYDHDSTNQRLFHDVNLMRGQSFQRDVLEDVFKIATIILALISVWFHADQPTTSIVQLARTIAFLTLMRYLLVFGMRLSCRFDQLERKSGNETVPATAPASSKPA